MIQVFDAQYAFASGATVNLAAIVALAGALNPGCSKILITPGASNSASISVTGPNGKQIKFIAKPTSATAQQDQFDYDIGHGYNLIQLGQFNITGTSGDVANITAFVG